MKKKCISIIIIIIVLYNFILSVGAAPPNGLIYGTGDLNADTSVSGFLMPWYNVSVYLPPNGTISGGAIRYHLPNYYDQYSLYGVDGSFFFSFGDSLNNITLYNGNISLSVLSNYNMVPLITSPSPYVLDGIFYFDDSVGFYIPNNKRVILDGYINYLDSNSVWQKQYINTEYQQMFTGGFAYYIDIFNAEVDQIYQQGVFQGKIYLDGNVVYGVDEFNSLTFPQVNIIYNQNRNISYVGTPVYSYSPDDSNIAHYISTHNISGSFIGNVTDIPTGTITINSNGEYDVSAYSTAVVDVPQHIIEDFEVFDWLYGAVNGFLQMEILPGFSLGGILLFIAGFALLVWILKIFLGG